MKKIVTFIKNLFGIKPKNEMTPDEAYQVISDAFDEGKISEEKFYKAYDIYNSWKIKNQ